MLGPSGGGRNPEVWGRGACVVPAEFPYAKGASVGASSWIPAFAGMTDGLRTGAVGARPRRSGGGRNPEVWGRGAVVP